MGTSLIAAAALAVYAGFGMGSAIAAVQYLGDGAHQNGATGGWDLPTQGSCLTDATKTTRPRCLALRLNYATKAACEVTPAPAGAWATSGVCNDLINTGSEANCTAGGSDRVWNPDTSICAIAMEDEDRNAVVCARENGNWITSGSCVGVWVFPAASSYTPPLLNTTSGAGTSAASTGPGPGDQCLRCHNSITQYNGVRIRDVEDVLYHGHKNMSRKVVAGSGWGGPPMECDLAPLVNTTEEVCEAAGGHWYPIDLYPTDDAGNVFDWVNGQISISGTARDVVWIYGDWLAPLPRQISKLPASTSKVCSNPIYTSQTSCELNGGVWIFNAGASYSCSRCHTTGWTSDASVNGSKEPEVSFPGITWNRTADAGFGVVNLSPGVYNDTNKYSSWDQFGILCSRCHSAAVDNASNGGVRPFSAPQSMSSHHNNMTAVDFPAGCSLSSCGGGRCTSSNCGTSGGVWYYGYCTDARYLVGGVPAATAKSNCETASGTNQEAYPGIGLGTWITPCSDNNAATATDCAGVGGTWNLPASSCSVAGQCNSILGAGHGGPYTTSAACLAAPLSDCPGGVTCQWANATDVVGCENAGGKWTGSFTRRGQIITSLCMQCHRQEKSGMPWADAADAPGSSASHPGSYVKVGQYHDTISFPSHPHGNMFLNSPHGRFSAQFNQIGAATFGNGYDSYFQMEGEAANTGNGCTGCHHVHHSVVEGTGSEEPVAPCQECHTGAYAIDLNSINHLSGTGTPLEKKATEPSEPCRICHMPEGIHMFRINPDPSYSTFPASVFSSSAVANANKATDGGFTDAVWVDVDLACGQCHGGGTAHATTTGSITKGTTALTVADATGFATGARVRIAGAYAAGGQPEDFDTYVSSVAGTTVTLVGKAGTTVSNAGVELGPTKNGAKWRSKATLAAVANGMHDAAGVTYGVTFSASMTGLTVNVNAQVNCGAGVVCPPLTYDWDWGDGSSTLGAGASSSHTYASYASETITLTVKKDGKVAGLATRSVTPTPPTATFTATVTGLKVDVVASASCGGPCPAFTYDWNWGDGSAHGTANPDTHTYAAAGTKTVTLTLSESGKTLTQVAKNVYPTNAVTDLAPAASATCTYNANTWVATVTDTSTDTDASPVQTISVDWGDKTSKSVGGPLATFTHTYLAPPVAPATSYTVTLTAVDTALKSSGAVTLTCTPTVAPAYFTITGTVVAKNGTTTLASAVVSLKRNGIAVKTVYTAANGTFSAGSLKPGTYTLTVSKTGYTFANPAATITVGPSGSVGTIVATGP